VEKFYRRLRWRRNPCELVDFERGLLPPDNLAETD
jgi:hypothetical protein